MNRVLPTYFRHAIATILDHMTENHSGDFYCDASRVCVIHRLVTADEYLLNGH